ncbi:MAG: hypothetical protein KBG20_21750 [Caldilineaceae bacterium]|nr:hypothetical protein [Caldilineaceae bacterium]MBP8108863.1 hypothetical protein [Caldilineaceae bacterium]MBP8125111.1 hypothetical protein [Caldilineaceae bacterium]MBP9074947.1 hypothetical protein [Caldilineaceae bacterium]
MSLLDSLKKLFLGGSGASKQGNRQTFPLYVQDHRCGEPMQGEVNLLNELSRGDGDADFYVRKVLHTTGKKRCFSQVEVELWFDNKRNFLRHQITGGKWLTADEYTAALARFNAPPEEEEPDTNEAEKK